jgi:hypothetical protein
MVGVSVCHIVSDFVNMQFQITGSKYFSFGNEGNSDCPMLVFCVQFFT